MNRSIDLKKIAIGIGIIGGIATFTAMNSVPYVLNNKIRKSEPYKQALKLINEHPEAIKYLGEPIKGNNVNVTKEENYGADDEKMWLRVPVSGSKGKGSLYFEFLKENINETEQLLSNVELVVDDFKDYKLIIKHE